MRHIFTLNRSIVNRSIAIYKSVLLLLLFAWALQANAQNSSTTTQTPITKQDSLFSQKEILATPTDTLLNQKNGAPVIGITKDTLFTISTKLGAVSNKDRASNASRQIRKLYDHEFFAIDSIRVVHQEDTEDIIYKDLIILSISEADAKIAKTEAKALATQYLEIIKAELLKAKEENNVVKLLGRVALVFLIISLAWFLIWVIRRGYNSLLLYVESKQDNWLKNLAYKEYTFITVQQEMVMIRKLIQLTRWIIYIAIIYTSLTIIFGIFPFSREWADSLFTLVWSPFKVMIAGIRDYLPHLFSLLVIAIVMKYVNQFFKYIFKEIEEEKLTITGFHKEWAMPTFNIIRFLLIAFTVILMFPHLPGSSSEVFIGVTIFIGLLILLGSYLATSNIIAGLVITYMRPFKVGDRIKLGDITGDVIEKTLLITRLRTQNNEEITIPNSTILIGNTINYTALSKKEGLIIHTTVTIGYNSPWPQVHKALEEAAAKTEHLLKRPKPFVLQTKLDDFYVKYQINAYTREASKQATIYSSLHQNIQDKFKEAKIDIISPHYRSKG